jgi:hypothetical protein
MKKKPTALVLKRETVRVLRDVSLSQVVGGGAMTNVVDDGCVDTTRNKAKAAP